MRSPSAGSVEDSSSARFQPSRRRPTPDGTPPVEGLRMSQARPHQPVMLAEVVELFAHVPEGLVVDATAGMGGHAEALLQSAPHISLLCLDRDPEAVRATSERLARYGSRAVVRHARFDALVTEAAKVGSSSGTLSGVLFDLGVSSPQLDVCERGFSYSGEGPLDMRMDPASSLSAADIVNGWDAKSLAELFAETGDERFASRIARAIVSARPLHTTTELAETVREAIPAPARRRGRHPARRVFLALRAAVNQELEQLASILPPALEALAPRGRCVAISYHSGEDRLVKEAFAVAVSGGCQCPPGLPCVCGARGTGRLVFRGARRPKQPEIDANPRAKSARLRAFERVDEGPTARGSSAGGAA